MPEDIKYIINESQLTAIGSAIRSKLGEQTLYTVDQMPTKIGNISGGGGINNPILTINIDGTGIPAQEQGAIPLFSINNGVLQKVNTAVSGGGLYSYETIVTEEVYPGDENYFAWNGDDSYPQITGTSRTLSVSNAINCQIQLDQANHRFVVMVENGTQPASFTLTIS